MKKSNKIVALWLLTICGFACHSVTDFLPMCWGTDIRIATDGVANMGMIAMMMTISYLLPACGVLLTTEGYGKKGLRVANAVLACLMALFNVAHALMELPTDNLGQYIIMPTMIVVGAFLALHSVKAIKEP